MKSLSYMRFVFNLKEVYTFDKTFLRCSFYVCCIIKLNRGIKYGKHEQSNISGSNA